ncbi:hypothetical protein F5884DRAFT_811623 [Xylogone sp. PMI_703]|nr:hypothetical protein F5884DRAFT_811623 [Xylogone sp. PMI_703]
MKIPSIVLPWTDFPYNPIRDDDIAHDESNSPCIEKHELSKVRDGSSLSVFLPWILCVILSLCLLLVLSARSFSRTQCSYEHEFSTEFFPIRSTISLHSTQFYGGIEMDGNGTMRRTFDRGGKTYAGPANPEIDEAWEELIGGRYFYITEDEAKDAWGDSYKAFHYEMRGDISYVAGLDVMHTLHCVDMLRRTLDKEYYENFPQPHFGRLHYDHCIDHLRQYIMCNADLTPVPTKWYPSLGRDYTDSDQIHTCRNYGQIREFVNQRDQVP